MKVLLSIKPEYVKKIFSGEKKYEYRKTVFKQNIDTIVVYSTKPEGKIVGEFKVEQILFDNPDNIWKETQKLSGIDYNFFKKYFNNKQKGYALKIHETILYECPIDPWKINKSFKPPQSFCYINDSIYVNS